MQSKENWTNVRNSSVYIVNYVFITLPLRDCVLDSRIQCKYLNFIIIQVQKFIVYDHEYEQSFIFFYPCGKRL